MEKIKKELNNKIIYLLIGILFIFNSTVYGITLSNKTCLRTPLAVNSEKGKNRLIEALAIISDEAEEYILPENASYGDVIRLFDDALNDEELAKARFYLEKLRHIGTHPSLVEITKIREADLVKKEEYLKNLNLSNWNVYLEYIFKEAWFNLSLTKGVLKRAKKIIDFVESHKAELTPESLETFRIAKVRFQFELERYEIEHSSWQQEFREHLKNRDFIEAEKILDKVKNFVERAKSRLPIGSSIFGSFYIELAIFERAIYKYVTLEAPQEEPFNKRHYDYQKADLLPTKAELKDLSIDEYLEIIGRNGPLLLLNHQSLRDDGYGVLSSGFIISGADRYELEHGTRNVAKEIKGFDRVYFAVGRWNHDIAPAQLLVKHGKEDKLPAEFTDRQIGFVFPANILLEEYYYSEDPVISLSQENEWSLIGEGNNPDDESHRIPLEYALVVLIPEAKRVEFQTFCAARKLNYSRVYFYKGNNANEGYEEFIKWCKENERYKDLILEKKDFLLGRARIKLSKKPVRTGEVISRKRRGLYGIRPIMASLEQILNAEGEQIEFLRRDAVLLNRAVVEEQWEVVRNYLLLLIGIADDDSAEYAEKIKQNIFQIFGEGKYSPLTLINILKQINFVKTQYLQNTGMPEQLEAHTLTMMEQFEKYFGDMILPAHFNRDLFRLICGALHDIGKPLAIWNGDRKKQHRITEAIIDELLPALPFSANQIELAKAVIIGDPIGSYLSNEITLEQAVAEIEQMLNRANTHVDISGADFFDLLTIYYQIDVSSYSQDTSSKISLAYSAELAWADGLFEWEEKGQEKVIVFDTQKHRLKFSPSVEQKFHILENKVKQIRKDQGIILTKESNTSL